MGTLISIVGVVVFLWIAYKQSKDLTDKEKYDRSRKVNDGMDMKMSCNPGITDDDHK